MNAAGASTDATGSRNGRGRSGARRRRAASGERPVQLRLAGEGARPPALGEARGVERGDEGDLQRKVEQQSEDDRSDHGERNVPSRSPALASELDRLLEAGTSEDDPAG